MRLVYKILVLTFFIVNIHSLSYSQKYNNEKRSTNSIIGNGSYYSFPHTLSYTTIYSYSINNMNKYINPISPFNNYMLHGYKENYILNKSPNLVNFNISSGSEHFPGLLNRQSLSMNFTFKYKRFTSLSGIEINRYLYDGIQNQYGYYSNLNFFVSNNISAVAYAHFYNTAPYYSMAAIPYVYSPEFGGFLSIQNNLGELDVGVRRRYDSFKRRWYTTPIITPTIKVGKIHIGLPVGELLYNSFKN